MKDNMKHIKSKKIFESTVISKHIHDMTEDIDDICLELKDEGFNISRVNYDGLPGKKEYRGNIVIAKVDRGDIEKFPFKYYESSEVVDRLKDYISKESIGGGLISVSVCSKVLHQVAWRPSKDVSKDTTVFGIAIIFIY